uniref:Uncharacterized protein n=1 Tax=Opuntia streptacantha TaxID=393608 RepID=A0A7C9DF77_OPUST
MVVSLRMGTQKGLSISVLKENTVMMIHLMEEGPCRCWMKTLTLLLHLCLQFHRSLKQNGMIPLLIQRRRFFSLGTNFLMPTGNLERSYLLPGQKLSFLCLRGRS